MAASICAPLHASFGFTASKAALHEWMEMMDQIRQYWENGVPMSFTDKSLPYKKKREFRYRLQDYMHSTFKFQEWKSKLVLDVGCGAGIDSAELLRNGADVVSLDLVKISMVSAKALFKEAGLSGKLVRADILHLPFKEEVFDCVYSFGVLHHIPDVERALGEVKRVLKLGGRFMGMLYHAESLLFAYSILHRGWKEGMTPEESLKAYAERRWGCPYVKVYTKNDAESLLCRFFVDVITEVHYDVVDLPNMRKVKFMIDGEGPRLGWHLVVKGVKASDAQRLTEYDEHLAI